MAFLAHKLIPGFIAVVMFLTTALCPCALGLSSNPMRPAHSCCERHDNRGTAPSKDGSQNCTDCGYARALLSSAHGPVNVAPAQPVAFTHIPTIAMAPSLMPVQRGDARCLDPCGESGSSLLRLHCALLV